jgi:hypothetical protein
MEQTYAHPIDLRFFLAQNKKLMRTLRLDMRAASLKHFDSALRTSRREVLRKLDCKGAGSGHLQANYK